MVLPHTKRHLNHFCRTGLLIAAIGLVAGMTGACSLDEAPMEAFYYLNKDRVVHHLRIIGWNEELAAKAQAWAEHMADANSLTHSDLAAGVSAGWSHLGENIGLGGSVPAVHVGFMNSAPHREAILNKQYSSVGVGVAERGGTVWIAEVFEG